MKNFLNAVWAFFAFVGGLFLLFRFKKPEEKPGLQSENIKLKVKLKEIEAANEIEDDFKNKSDRDIVLDAINSELGTRKPKS